MSVLYNEIDPVACAVLREASSNNIIAPGTVLERSIKDVTPDEVRRHTQVHWFAGAGLWSVAARLAGWPDDRPLWSASCPCQPFSVAGKGAGFDDERDLWPDFFRLVRQCRPPIIVGEQVAAASGRATPQQIERFKGMQRVRDREAIVDVLQSLGYGGRDVFPMSGVPERGAEGAAPEPRESGQAEGQRETFASQESDAQARFLFGERSEEPGAEDGTLFQSGWLPGRDPVEDLGWLLRDDGHTVQSEEWGRPHLGQPITGQDRPDDRVRDHERARDPFLPKRDDEQLGRSKTDRGGRGAEEEEAQRADADGSVGSELEAQARRDWLDRMHDDLEGEGYSVRTVSVAACSVDAPHRRQRLYWVAVADASSEGSLPASHLGVRGEAQGERPWHVEPQRRDGGNDVANPDRGGRDGRPEDPQRGAFRGTLAEWLTLGGSADEWWGQVVSECDRYSVCRDPNACDGKPGQCVGTRRTRAEWADVDDDSLVGQPDDEGLEGQRGHVSGATGGRGIEDRPPAAPTSSYWSDAYWLQCADGKARRAPIPESYFRGVDYGISGGTERFDPSRLLVPSFKGRTQFWRLVGNAIVPQVAAEVLACLMETIEEESSQ